MVRRVPLATVVAAMVALAQTPIAEMKVTGASTLSGYAIVAETGVRTGQAVTSKELDAAMNRLFETGLFASVKYRYDPGPKGLTLTWMVEEDSSALPVELDIAGVEEAQLWAELNRGNPLLRKTIPENENATAYYRRAIESALKALGKQQEVTGKVEGDLATGKLSMVFRSPNAPEVVSVRFEGNRALESKPLVSAMEVVAKGQPYSERQLRKMLDLNVRPLYEERGYLTVAFPEVAIAGGEVSIRVEEGPQWHLGKVELVGEGIPVKQMLEAAEFPEGELAGWKRILSSIQSAEKILKSAGYLEVHSRPVRRFREETRIVDLTIEVERGRQFVFGELRISGFSEAMRRRAFSMWKLKPGAPMDEPYVTGFLRTLGDSGFQFQSVNLNVEPRPGTNIVDVSMDFK